MRTSVQALIALVIVILVVVGIYGATSNVFGQTGDNIEQGGNESGSRMECIFNNPRSSDTACQRESSLEVKTKNVQKA